MSNVTRLFIYTLSVTVLGLLVTAVSGKRLNNGGPQPTNNLVASHSAANASTNDERGSDLTALVFTVRPTGFEPEELVVTAGRVVVVVQNRSGRRDLSIQLQRENGERLHSVRQQRLDWKYQTDLRPGTYFLIEEGHPNWRCIIRVTPQ